MILDYLKKGLSKTREGFVGKIEELVTGYKKLDDDFFDELEEILIQADIGAVTSMELVERLKKEAHEQKIDDSSEAITLLKKQIERIMGHDSPHLNLQENGLTVILVVGVNGAGKTTSIGKIAYTLRQQGKKVVLAAGDTFRAAATEQLERWAEDVGASIIKQNEGADPASVAYDALQSAKAKNADVLLVDTAGRLHTKVNLMEEIKKIKRVLEREYPGAPHETLLVVDATTGQNAIEQAKLFNKATGITGIVLTKLDGSAKGGIVIPIADRLEIPVKLIGVGEGKDDLRQFSPKDYADTLFSK
ncbi:signal recognition particle-docking protein FtsY [Clostridia bacterium]|nr:signal recognition particle-docking protein FtsY [Clostridia bacterium]